MPKYLLYVLTLSSLLIFSGCSTVTKPENNKLPSTAESGSRTSPALTQTGKTLKRKVAIARFTDESRHGNAFLINQNEDRVGKQASDILATRLSRTGKFLMLERSDLDKIRSEQALTNQQLQQIGADYLIVGSISEFGRSAESEVGIFSRNKIQTARAKVNVRLIDVRTGQIIFSQEGSGEASAEANSVFGVGARAAYDSSLDDKAISAAISQLINNLVNNLLDQPWRAYVIAEQDGQYIVTGGQSQGIRVGDEFRLMKAGRTVKNPQTGLLLELPGQQIGQLRVEALAGEGDNEISLTTLMSGDIDDDKLGELYVLSKQPAS